MVDYSAKRELNRINSGACLHKCVLKVLLHCEMRRSFVDILLSYLSYKLLPDPFDPPPFLNYECLCKLRLRTE